MMRIKEAIQRRKLIQQLNDEYAAIEDDSNINVKHSLSNPLGGPNAANKQNSISGILHKKACGENQQDANAALTDSDIAYLKLHEFVTGLNQRLNDSHRRALRVTWKRLSEPPKTSGRGTLQIMEKVFDQTLSDSPETLSVFYRSAFLKCIEERRTGCASGTIVTVRDHAHLLIDLIDGIMSVMFDTPFHKPVWDPATIGRAHVKYISMGFNLNIWQKLGECFAEVMFSQECVRAYPHAASAWSMLSVAITEKMYSNSKYVKHSDRTHADLFLSTNSKMPRKEHSVGSLSTRMAAVFTGRKLSQRHCHERKKALVQEPQSSMSETISSKNSLDSMQVRKKLLRQASIPIQGPTFFATQNMTLSSNYHNHRRSSSFDTRPNSTTLVRQANESMWNTNDENSTEQYSTSPSPRMNYKQTKNKKKSLKKQKHFSTSGESTNV